MKAYIDSIAYALPKKSLTNSDLVQEFPEWSIEKIEQKTGIRKRQIVQDDECASDIAVQAAKNLFDSNSWGPGDIDYLILCTQSPDYFLPTTACLLQERIGIPTRVGALDINLGCSGYVYGLGMAKGLIETGQSERLLFITAETYSKFIHPGDKSVRTLFGDAATATLLCSGSDNNREMIGPFVYGTDGRGGENLIVPNGGMRSRTDCTLEKISTDSSGNTRSANNLYMNGSEIFTFTFKKVPEAVEELLKKTGKTLSDIDYFIFHQANYFMLEHLRKKIKIPKERFILAFSEYGNTVSSSIPIALKDAQANGTIRKGDVLMLVGFGVGYSWGATLVEWGVQA